MFNNVLVSNNDIIWHVWAHVTVYLTTKSESIKIVQYGVQESIVRPLTAHKKEFPEP